MSGEMVHLISYSSSAIKLGLLKKLETIRDLKNYTVIALDDPQRGKKLARFISRHKPFTVLYYHGVFRPNELMVLRLKFTIFQPDVMIEIESDFKKAQKINHYGYEATIPRSQLCFGYSDFWMERFLKGDYLDYLKERNREIRDRRKTVDQKQA